MSSLPPDAEIDCSHPPEARITYRDRAAPLGREGDERCDVCGERVGAVEVMTEGSKEMRLDPR